MIHLKLFWEFLKIGLFSFGGAYGAIPFIKECVSTNHWMDEAMFANMLAISESTPGPIMVNSATYIGNQQAGVLGSALATLGVVLPAFVIILLICALLKKWIKSPAVQGVLHGIEPCLMGVILATGASMICSIVFSAESFDGKSLLIFVILVACLLLYRKFLNKALSPIWLIVLAGVLGIFVF